MKVGEELGEEIGRKVEEVEHGIIGNQGQVGEAMRLSTTKHAQE